MGDVPDQSTSAQLYFGRCKHVGSSGGIQGERARWGGSEWWRSRLVAGSPQSGPPLLGLDKADEHLPSTEFLDASQPMGATTSIGEPVEKQ